MRRKRKRRGASGDGLEVGGGRQLGAQLPPVTASRGKLYRTCNFFLLGKKPGKARGCLARSPGLAFRWMARLEGGPPRSQS